MQRAMSQQTHREPPPRTPEQRKRAIATGLALAAVALAFYATMILHYVAR
jgi:hypothetical protein